MTKMTDDDFNESEMFSPQAAAAAIPVPPVEVAVPASVDTTDHNPLSRYFRLPGLSVKLPTMGAFFPKGGVELDSNGEVAVYPMRAADELLLASPDALMNNTAITNLIRSCVPAIKTPEYISAPDLDALLIAIRVASNGETMELEMECPECKKPSNFEIFLPVVLSGMQTIPEVNPLRLSDDVVIYLRPHTVAVQSRVLISAFKETRKAQAIDANTELTDEERSEKLTKVMDTLSDMNIDGIAHSVVKVVVPGYEVVNLKHIKEFLANTDKKTLARLRDEMERLNAMGIDKTVDAVCSHCNHEWKGAIEFNPSTFFEDRSSD